MSKIIHDKLKEKIYELKEKGIPPDEIVKETAVYLKKVLKEVPFKEREKFFVKIERKRKIDNILC